MKKFDCPVCSGPTEKVWENATQTRIGMKCKNGHANTGNQVGGSKQFPVILVSNEELDK
jgi:hypothetical protein